MALDRQLSTGGDHPKVAAFWEKVHWLLDRESGELYREGTFATARGWTA